MSEQDDTAVLALRLDEGRCEGYGFCEERAASLVRLDDEGALHVLVEHVDGDDVELARRAVRACPVAALRLETAGA